MYFPSVSPPGLSESLCCCVLCPVTRSQQKETPPPLSPVFILFCFVRIVACWKENTLLCKVTGGMQKTFSLFILRPYSYCSFIMCLNKKEKIVPSLFFLGIDYGYTRFLQLKDDLEVITLDTFLAKGVWFCYPLVSICSKILYIPGQCVPN